MKRIAIFASGSGSNAQNIMEYFKQSNTVVCDLLLSNNKNAYALERAKKYDVDTFMIERESFYNSSETVKLLKNRKIDLIVLSGFLWLVPQNLIANFPIINIHPALLPKYGGKGMYGMNVHKAVVKNREKESGISIHFVNEIYDDGKIVFQAKCEVVQSDSAEMVAEKVHQLEYKHFPKVIEKVLLGFE